MKHLLIIFLALSSSAFSQTEADYKDYLVDSLRKAGVDTILVVKNSCYNCSSVYMDKSKKDLPCSFGSTYTLIWLKSKNSNFMQFDQCYETANHKSQSNEWITHYLKNWKVLTTSWVIQSDSLIVFDQDTIYYSKCADAITTPIFDYLPNDSYLLFEMHFGNNVYRTGEITNNLLCHPNTKNKSEIKVFFELNALICETYLYNPDFYWNKKPTQLKKLD